MKISKHLILFLLINTAYTLAQNTLTNFIRPELSIGKTLEANTGFPNTNPQTSLFISFGKHNTNITSEWAYRLKYPKTGIAIGYINFGNNNAIGQAITLLPFAEFNLLKKKTNKLSLQIGIGTSYINTQYHPITNQNNKAVTTDLNWSFKSYFYYEAFKNWRLGLGYIHHSNGHTRLPNQGLNSLLASISKQFNFNNSSINALQIEKPKTSKQTYFSTRFGLGQNALSEFINDKKEVYSVAFSIGTIINKTFKFGGGIYYRFYEHYYDYIKHNGELVIEDYSHFQDNSFGYATNVGIFGAAELLLGNFGFEFNLGINIYKPFYKVDWRLNQGYNYVNSQGETVVILGDLNWYYEIKRTISSRLGLKYYVINTDKTPNHNVFISAHINANLGQADFTEISLGYVRRFNFKEKK